MRKLYTTLLGLLFILPFTAHAQVLWDFTADASGNPTSVTPATIIASAITTGNNTAVAPFINATSKSSGYTQTGGAAASGGNNASAIAVAGALNTGASAYFEFTVTPSSGNTITLTELDFGSRSTGTGPLALSIRSSLDNFASDVATSAASANSNYAYHTNAISLAGATDQAITIRIFGSGGTGTSSSANWRVDDIQLAFTTSGGGGGPTPSVTATPNALSGFATTQGTASASQSTSVSGSNLTTSTVDVTPPAGFEVSTDNTTFGASTSLPVTSGTLAATPLFVRIAANANPGAVSGNLGLSSGAITISVPLSGTVTPLASPAADVVINQVYGGGGNSGATYTNDFIELFNDADTTVPLTGWSVQYSSATGTSWQVTPLTGSIPSHGFFLIQEAKGSAGTTALPTPDVTGTIAMSGADAKVVLCNTTAAQSGANPTGGNVIDKVGYGVEVNGFETAPTADLTNTTAARRVPDGVDNNNNSTDFQILAPLPRNSGYTTTPPVIVTINPANGTSNLPVNFIPTIIFSKPISKGTGSIFLVNSSGVVQTIPISDARIAIGGDTVSFNFTLAGNTTYEIGVPAGTITDVYGNTFTGLDSTAWKFSTFDNTAPATLPYVNDFESCTGSGLLSNGFTQYSVTGPQVWDCSSFGADTVTTSNNTGHAAEINGYAGSANHLNEDWLISPQFDLSGTDFPLLNFWSRNAFTGAPLQLKVSTDYTGSGDPRLATWNDINGHFPSVGSDVWTRSANINLMAFKQTGVYFAFVYTSTTQDGSRWDVDDISLINSLTPPPPTLTLSESNIAFGFTSPGIPVTKRLTVTGNDLTSAITVTSEGSYTVSTDSLTFSNSITIGADTANNLPEPVFVRFNPATTNAQFIDSVLVSISDSTAIVDVQGNSIDPSTTLTIVDWNLNWFGTPDSTLGVANKSLQETNVATILPTLHADLYALEEVVNQHALDSIVGTMPGYAYVVGQYGSYSNPNEPTADPLTEVQKLAFIYNTSKITPVRTDSLLTLGVTNPADISTAYYNDWASGRFPYMLTANVTLNDPNGGTNSKLIRFINIHGKSNLSPVLTSYQRRQAGANALDSLIKADYISDNVMVLGDFNDDLNQTITAGIIPPVTSYNAFTQTDSTLYQSPTKVLSQEMQHSDVNYTSVIDNQIINNAMAAWYLPSSASVQSNVASLVTNYGTTTTDHYPVMSQFSFTPPTPLPVTLVSFTGQRQDQSSLLTWITTSETNSKLFNIQRSSDGKGFTTIGTVAAQGTTAATTTYHFTDAQPLTGKNYYRLQQVDIDGKFTYSKTVVLEFSGNTLTLKIDPNPAHGTAYLYLANASEALSIQLVNMNGQLIKQWTTTPGTTNINVDVSGLAKGLYTVKAISGNGVVLQKLVVQ